MKTMLKKTMSWVLVLATVLSLAAAMTVSVSAAVVTLDKAGPNITAVYNTETKTLQLSGTGEMYDYLQDGDDYILNMVDRPWESYVGYIQTVIVNPGITKIGNAAFYGLTSCTAYSFPNGLSVLGEWALANNSALRSVTLPSSLTRVRKFAFFSTPLTSDGLKNSIAYGSTVIEAGKAVNTYLINDLTADSVARVTYEASGAVVQEDGRTPSGIEWKYTSSNKTLTLTNPTAQAVALPAIGGNAPWSDFNGEIRSIVVGDKITEIGKYAFQGMTAVSSVNLGKDVAAIRQYAFAGCAALKALQLPSATLVVEANAFGSRNTGNTITVSTPNSELYIKGNATVAGHGDFSQNGNQLVIWSFGTYTPPTQGGTTPPPTQGTADKSGLINNTIQWTYTASNGLLSFNLVSGVTAAAIPDYTSYALPWSQTALGGIVTTVSIGNGITGIGDYAFANMPYLNYVSFGSSVQTIGSYAFANDTSLTMIALPASLAYVEAYAFSGCPLTYAHKANQNTIVYTPNTELLAALGGTGTGGGTTPPPTQGGTNVENVIPGTTLTWSYNTATRSLNIRGTGAIPSYTSAAATPWAAYATDITAIMVQTGITGIGNYAFSGIAGVTDLYLPATLTSIGAYAFSNCTSLKSIEIPAAVQTINEYTFFNCVSLEDVVLPANLKQIGTGAFYGCKALSVVDFPAQLQIIGEKAFYDNTALTGVIFRSPSLYIGNQAFGNCPMLSKAVCLGAQPTAAAGNELLVTKYVSRFGTGSNGNASWDIDRVTGVLTVTGVGDLTNATGWKDELAFADTVVINGFTTVGANLLKGNTALKNIVLSDSVQTVGVSAFEGCTNLKSVTFSKNLATMGARAFYGCSKLTKIELPNTLTMIPEEAFAACTGLTSVKFGNKTVSIGPRAFAGCSALTALELPVTLATLSTGAFTDCYSLTKLTMSAGALTAIPQNVFNGCVSLNTVYFNGTQAQWSALTANADAVIKAAYVINCTTVTLYYEYEGGPLNGQAVQAADVFTGAVGSSLTVTLPVVEHYAADATTKVVTFGATNTSYYVKYKPKTYTVTISFVDDVTGVPVAESKVYDVQYMGSLTTPSFNLTGYTLQENPITVTNVTENVNKVVKCTKKSYTYTVEYVNERTGNVFYTETGTQKYGEAVNYTPKAMTGYTVKAGEYKIPAITGEGHKLTVTYVPESKTLTIHYVDKDGTKIAEDVTKTVYYGEAVSVESPVKEGKTPDKAVVAFDKYNGETEVTVTYDWTYYTVTVRFKEKDSVDYSVHADFTAKVKHGDTFTFNLADHAEYPTPAAYVTDVTTLNFGAVTQDKEMTITYSRKNLTLTVNYVDAKGNVLDTDLLTVPAGTTTTVEAKQIEGYFDNEAFTHQMGTEDESLTIEMEIDPEAPVHKSNTGKVIGVIVIILLVLVTGGALFYFLYLKKKPQW